MKVLVANNHLKNVGGSETFTYTIIEGIKSMGHEVEYFTFHKGYVSNLIENELGVNFMSKKKYDLILANHYTTVDTLKGKGFIIQTCHGIYPKLEQPSKNADFHVSISQEVQDYIAFQGFPSILIHNSINIKRFKPSKQPNEKVKTILSLCHSEEANDFVEQACKKLGITFLKAYKYGNAVWAVEKVINKADLVIGLGRSAYESMSCGRPVIIFDNRRYFPSYSDGYISHNLNLSLKNNCSGRYFKKKLNVNELILEIKKFNREDGKILRSFAIEELDVQKNLLKYFSIKNKFVRLKEKQKKEKRIRILKKILGQNLFKIIMKIRSKVKSKIK